MANITDAGVLERILAMGVTGSGKSYQWLKMAEELLPSGVKFRCIDTDNAISFMLKTQFPHLMPENKGNVYVHPAFDWPDYQQSILWIQRKMKNPKILESYEDNLAKDYRDNQVKPSDWTIIDMVDNAWRTVQRFFTEEVFQEDIGSYFLQIRKELAAGVRKTKSGKAMTSLPAEVFDGWKDWVVMNKLYDDFILPVVYRIRTHTYATTKVEQVDRKTEKDEETLLQYGELGIRPAGQKALGHQMHSIFLFIPGYGKEKGWKITTIKDRGNRGYFSKTVLTSFFYQYMIAKARWSVRD